jgi:hypothetical protein
MITEAEMNEMETLLKQRDISISRKRLCDISIESNPNYKVLFNAISDQKYEMIDGKPKLISGYRGTGLEGSSRSGKTWSGIDIIIWLCLFKETKGCTINIYRETYNEFKTTLYDDFKRRLDDFGLPNKFKENDEIKSFKIGNSKIFFIGDGKHGGGCDYAFFNEVMFIKKGVFDQVKIRCRKFWWADYNPSFTEHWFFDNALTRPDVAFLRTTFQDNKFISAQEHNEIVITEPWKSGSYIIKDDVVQCYNKQTGKVEPLSPTNQPPPHSENIKNGTADESYWRCYGLGLRGAMKGVIFPYVSWIDTFPEDKAIIYANDFGFTTDPNTLVRYAEDNFNIWIEPLCYEPIEDPDNLIEFYNSQGLKPNSSDTAEDGDIIICDSADKYTGENKGTVEMVKSLRKALWNAKKVSKTKSVMFWLGSMKKKKIHIIKNHLYKQALKEQQNYKMREISGISINQPLDKFNHIWDAARYGHIAHNSKTQIFSTDQDTIKSINY